MWRGERQTLIISNRAAFERAINKVIERHEALRTVFRTCELGEPQQVVLAPKNLGFELNYIDLQNTEEQTEKITDYRLKDAYKPFDLENGPLFRACLMQVDQEEYAFYFNMHHIISDGWSMDVLSNDIGLFYEEELSGNISEHQALRIQYKDYASWQLAEIESGKFKVHQAYWKSQFKDEIPVLNLRAKGARPKVAKQNGRRLDTYISSKLSKAVNSFSQANNGSLFMTLLATWNALCFRYTNQKDFVVGTPVAGREHPRQAGAAATQWLKALSRN